MANKKKKLAIFNRYSKNFTTVASNPYYNWGERETPQDLYFCPICLNGFKQSDLKDNKKENHLTFEHIPQKKIGGQPDILTCRVCNSKHNISDRELANEIKLLSFFRGDDGSELRNIDVTISDTRFKANVKKKDGKIYFGFKKNDLSKAIELMNGGHSINFRGNTPNTQKTKIAILKSAYLTAFKMFGYGFMFHTSFQPIRQQLFNPNEEILPSCGALFGLDRAGIFVVKEPLEARSYFVNFKLKIDSRIFYAGALIPAPSMDVIEFYSGIKTLTDGQGQVSVTELQPFNYVLDPNHAFKSYDIGGYFR